MSTLQTHGPASASPPPRYLYWRAPSGFWIRRVRWEEHMEIMAENTLPRDRDRPSIPRTRAGMGVLRQGVPVRRAGRSMHPGSL